MFMIYCLVDKISFIGGSFVATPTHNKKNYNRKNQKSNKGLFITLGTIFAVCILFLILYPLFEGTNPVYGVSNSKLNAYTKELLDDPNYANTISDKDLDAKIANKEDFFVYMYSASCSHCRATTPLLVPLTEQINVHMDQFNLLEFEEYFKKMNVEYTPTLIYFEDGVEKERIVGGIATNGAQGNTYEDYQAFFERNQLK